MASDEHLRRALELFDAALEQPEPQREAWLHAQCAGDAALLAQVRALLAADAHDSAADLCLNPLAAVSAEAATTAPAEALLGERIGAWRITGVLGRGGMGAVYAVERADGQFAQQAALKRVRIGLDSPAARDRFLRERQILAGLHHPGIARLLDGGTDAHNAPYFVMERVDGEPIDRWCDARRLSLRARVTLFLQVLDAVAYAHRNLVVHRDLKPSNLLVDVQGRARLLDFGIARLCDGETGSATGTLDRVLTPEFAAPEQILGDAVGTATDIYQLGLLLFRLLTGAHPHGITAQTTLRRQLELLGVDAGRASSAVLKADQAQALARRASPDQLARQLRGDLDVILAKAMQREPEARYADVASLREDLAAWLDGRPVAARAPTFRYRAGRFVRRNRWTVAGGVFTLCVILIGSGVSLWQARQAKREAARADAVSAYLAGIFTSIDPEHGWNRNVGVRDLLDDGARRLDAGALADQPAAEARLRGTLAQTYAALGDYAAARAQVNKALGLDTHDPQATVQLRIQQAELQQLAGEYRSAAANLAALEAELTAHGTAHADALDLVHGKQADLAEQMEDLPRALRLGEAVYRSALTRHGASDARTQAYQQTYALLLGSAGKTGAAVQLQRALLATQRTLPALPKATLATTLHNLATLTNDDGHPAEAIAYADEALRLRQAALPAQHPLIARSLAYLAYLQGQANRREPALRNFASAVALLDTPAHPDDELLANTHNNWAVTCYQFSDLTCARTHLDAAITLWSRLLPADHSDLLSARNNLAAVLNETGALAEAEGQIRQIIAARRAKHSRALDDALGLAAGYNMLTFNLSNQDRPMEALEAAQQALASLQDAGVSDQAALGSAWNSIAFAEWRMGRCVDSLEHARRAIEMFEQAGAHDRLPTAQLNLARCLVRDPASARAGIAQAEAVRKAVPVGSNTGQQARAAQAEGWLILGQRENANALADALIAELIASGKPQSRTIVRMQAVRSGRLAQ